MTDARTARESAQVAATAADPTMQMAREEIQAAVQTFGPDLTMQMARIAVQFASFNRSYWGILLPNVDP